MDYLAQIKSVLRTQHGGPGPHKSGSPQDVHGDPGSDSTSSSGKAGSAGGYKSRPVKSGDFDSLTRGTNEAEWNTEQQVSMILFNDEKSKVLVDSDGLVQAHYHAELVDYDGIWKGYEMEPFALDDFTEDGTSPYEVHTLGVSPRHLKTGDMPGEQRGWGLSAMHEVIGDARAAGADFIFLSAMDEARGFYENIGMTPLEELGYPGLYVMPESNWDKFEEAYDDRFK